jgi:hypothetical protein
MVPIRQADALAEVEILEEISGSRFVHGGLMNWPMFGAIDTVTFAVIFWGK